jgi:hypothetical protein
MGRLKNMQDKVEYVLRMHPVTRDDDRLLICAVYSHFYGVDLCQSFGSVLIDNKLPSFETIGRCRRKAQEEHEELRGKRDKERIERQKDFIEYATQGE